MTPEERAEKAWLSVYREGLIPAVATAIREAISAEREACAQVCVAIRHENYASETDDWVAGTAACAAAIRKRGET